MTDSPVPTAEQQFDEKNARRVESIYLTPDVSGHRTRVLELLAPVAGECVLDIGCGPGLLTRDLAFGVGPRGRVRAMDVSAPMVALAQRRCAGMDWVTVERADAAALPFADAQADAAVITQVYEYVPDVAAALAELARVLRPGGRALIMDTDWESAVWASADNARMRRVVDVWNKHVPHAQLPRELHGLLRAAGLEVVAAHALPLLNVGDCKNTYSAGMTSIIAEFVAGRDGIGDGEARQWRDDLLARGESGEYFFSLNRYVFVATRPDRSQA